MSNEFLSQTPINGFPLEKGSQHALKLDFKWLSRQLKNGGVMKHNEIMSQINITEDCIMLYVKDKGSKL